MTRAVPASEPAFFVDFTTPSPGTNVPIRFGPVPSGDAASVISREAPDDLFPGATHDPDRVQLLWDNLIERNSRWLQAHAIMLANVPPEYLLPVYSEDGKTVVGQELAFDVIRVDLADPPESEGLVRLYAANLPPALAGVLRAAIAADIDTSRLVLL